MYIVANANYHLSPQTRGQRPLLLKDLFLPLSLAKEICLELQILCVSYNEAV